MTPPDFEGPTLLKSSFAPAAGPDTRVLVLGSLPGEVSLAQNEYYAHPRNQFWRLMEIVTGAPLHGMPYPARLAALATAGVGLWDVIRSASRVGSLDAAIRFHEANGLLAYTATLPSLRAVAYNGAKASAIGRSLLGGDPGFAQISLPSSSPAHTAPFADKAIEWRRIQAFLDPVG